MGASAMKSILVDWDICSSSIPIFDAMFTAASRRRTGTRESYEIIAFSEA
jgi:hypothetical protein